MNSNDGTIRYDNGYLVIRLKGSNAEHEILMRGLVQVLRAAYTEATQEVGQRIHDPGYVEAVFDLLETLLPDEEQLAKGSQSKPEQPK